LQLSIEKVNDALSPLATRVEELERRIAVVLESDRRDVIRPLASAAAEDKMSSFASMTGALVSQIQAMEARLTQLDDRLVGRAAIDRGACATSNWSICLAFQTLHVFISIPPLHVSAVDAKAFDTLVRRLDSVETQIAQSPQPSLRLASSVAHDAAPRHAESQSTRSAADVGSSPDNLATVRAGLSTLHNDIRQVTSHSRAHLMLA
jgi:hypothetical protein